MAKSKIIIFAAVILVVAGFIFWSYPIVKERYFKDEPADKETMENGAGRKENVESNGNNEDIVEDIINTEETENNEDEFEPVEEDEPFFEVSPKDCSDKCQKYEKDAEDFEYCRQVCGLASFLKTGDCSDLEGLEKDYCWKDLAVSKKDFSLCDRIRDAEIKKICKNRITEEILNNRE